MIDPFAPEASPGALLAALGPVERAAVLGQFSDAELAALVDWRLDSARNQQYWPGEWTRRLVLAGRGFGKTFAGALWVNLLAGHVPGARIALVGATHADARKVMIEGPAGVLAVAPRGARPRYQPSQRRLHWPNGALAEHFSAEEPDALRGPQFAAAWGDEAARWPDGKAVLANLTLGLRLGDRPQLLLTTTPRPLAWLKALAAAREWEVTRGATHANAANLPATYLARIVAEHGGTRLGRQEIDGEFVEEAEGALWRREIFEAHRVAAAPELARVIVAVDPPAGAGPGADACGIVAAGLGKDRRFYVLADASTEGAGPEQWAAAVATLVRRVDADRVIAEANQGGAMVGSVLRAADAALPVTLAHAVRGKTGRAEPVAVLYGKGQVSHAGAFPVLEDELCGMLAGGGYAGPGRSPDRADALVWALSELVAGRAGQPGLRCL